jgi:hypothetical protein
MNGGDPSPPQSQVYCLSGFPILGNPKWGCKLKEAHLLLLLYLHTATWQSYLHTLSQVHIHLSILFPKGSLRSIYTVSSLLDLKSWLRKKIA